MKRYRDLPRRTRIAGNLLAVLLLAILACTLWGGPAVTVEQRLRRAEQANLVGPGKHDAGPGRGAVVPL